MAAHVVYSAYSAPIFAVSSAITSSGSSMHDPPEDTLPIVLKAAHCATILVAARRSLGLPTSPEASPAGSTFPGRFRSFFAAARFAQRSFWA